MNGEDRILGGRYEVGELLGYGGMAEVHHARDMRLGRDVAIKMLRTDLARDATFQARFRREAQNAASLNHPAIVAVYDTGEEKGSDGEALPYIVMEFVDGRTLKEVLGAEGPLAPDRALDIVADTCAALEFSHRHGIIHRDIKPGNIMLTSAGQVKVMDFGIARAVAGTTTTMTQTSAVIGTAQYLSPEQARGETVDARSDVYATGCVLFELLTGAPPFTGDSPVSVAYQHVREEPKCPSERDPSIPPAVDAVVLKALAKNPANRYQSAAEMRSDLLRAANGRPVQAPAVLPAAQRTQVMSSAPVGGGIQPRVTDPARRRRAMWVLISLALLVVLALTATGIGLYLSSQNSEQAVLPSVKGEKQQQAERVLKHHGFTNIKIQRVNSPRKSIGKVTGQYPTAGQEYAKHSQVTLNVGQGPKSVRVPSLTDLNGQDAVRSLLNQHELHAKFQYENSVKNHDDVIDSAPEAGTKVPIHSIITVYLSRGNEAVVPDVTGKMQSDAQIALKNAGFTFNVQTATDTNGAQPGSVVSQSPNGGGAALKGSTVTIYVAPQSSPSPSPSPSVSPSPSPSPSPSRSFFAPPG